jgi:hypothetical protein
MRNSVRAAPAGAGILGPLAYRERVYGCDALHDERERHRAEGILVDRAVIAAQEAL